MKFNKPPFRLYHLMILVVILAGIFATMPAPLAFIFSADSLITFLIIPTCKPETFAESLMFLVVLGTIGLVVVFAAVEIFAGRLPST